ncbi:MAG: hypothetical protein AB7E09_06880 [Candidatus Izemoplasmatales bacterium]
MFNFLKKKNNDEELMKVREEEKSKFRNKLEINKSKNATFEAMYILFNDLDIEIVELMRTYNLYIDFDFVDEDQYYEVMVQTTNCGKKGMYTTVGTEQGKNIMTLDSTGDTISTDGLTSEDIISKVINEIKLFYNK